MENIPLGFVYYLQNPITGEIFYIGATEVSLKNRLRTHYQHLHEMKKGQRKTNKRYEYLLNLQPVKAKIYLLEIVTNGELFEREKFYISKFRKINPNLTNMTNGGQGQYTTEYYSKEQKTETGKKISLKLKGIKKPQGFSQHLSDIRHGLNNPNAKGISIGWIVVDEKILFKYGFEINNFINKKDAYGNVYKHFINKRTGNPYGHKWELFSKLSKEIQDIVQSSYENKKQ